MEASVQAPPAAPPPPAPTEAPDSPPDPAIHGQAPPIVEEPPPGDQHQPEDPVTQADEEEDLLEPRVLPVPRVLIDDQGRSHTYIQKELTYFGKWEFYGVLGRAIRTAMSGENGMGVDELMSMTRPKDIFQMINENLPGAETAPDREEVEGSTGEKIEQAGKVMIAVAGLAEYAPELLKECYCIWLGIPKGHRRWAMDFALETLDDDTGDDIAITFVHQNWAAMDDFFRRRLPRLVKEATSSRRRFDAARSTP